GRVLLAGLEDAALQAYLSSASLKKLTNATLIDRALLGQEIVRVREQGWAWIDGELDESICGLAVPVRDPDGHTVAAINVSLPAGDFDQAGAVAQFLLPLRRTASRIRSAYA
nr:IclR family transcriptional regulator C-terminal domain-containing protein [Burkholderiaceae bacterium]